MKTGELNALDWQARIVEFHGTYCMARLGFWTCTPIVWRCQLRRMQMVYHSVWQIDLWRISLAVKWNHDGLEQL